MSAVLSANEKTPRVLTVLPDFPFPTTTGLHLRMVSNLDLVHRLGCFSSLLYFTTEEREPPSVASTPLTTLCDEVRHGGRRFPHADFSTSSLVMHKLDFLVYGALALPGKTYPFSMSYDRIDAGGIIAEEARRIKADFVILPSFMAHYTAALRKNGVRVIADAIDVLSDLTSRFLAEYSTGPMSRTTLYANYLASRTQERRYLPQCCEIWATSQPEAVTLRRISSPANVVVVANSLDERQFEPAPLVHDLNVGFIGTYSSRPNLDAAIFLARSVFPIVLLKFPRARLKIAGANLPRADEVSLRALGYVDVLGAVADSNELYGQCRVIALPVFVRGGVPLKIVEAMSRGKAVVACDELVAGLEVQNGCDVVVAKGAGEFAEAICTLFSDDELCRRLGRSARETFMKHWSRAHAERVLRQSSVLVSTSDQRNG